MLECLKFILKCVIDLVTMLFRIDVGFTNLGVVMCICYILFPMLLVIVNFFRSSLMEELDERYDESFPINTNVSSYHEHTKLGPGISHHYSNSVTVRRRMRK